MYIHDSILTCMQGNTAYDKAVQSGDAELRKYLKREWVVWPRYSIIVLFKTTTITIILECSWPHSIIKHGLITVTQLILSLDQHTIISRSAYYNKPTGALYKVHYFLSSTGKESELKWNVSENDEVAI